MAPNLFLLLLLLVVLSAPADGGSDSDSDSPLEKPNLRSRSLIVVKLWCLILVFLGTFAGGMSPYFMKLNEGFLIIGTQFAGGVFLGTALMHFLSDSNETFQELTSKEYPFSFMLAAAGYLITMFADCLVSFVYAKNQNRNRNRNHQASPHSDLELQANPSNSAGNIGTLSSDLKPQDNNVKEGQASEASVLLATSLGDSVLLIGALCFHSVFEGIAIGVAETKADAWRALWTVCLHKIFAAIAMGIALLRMMPQRPLISSVSYAFAFAISSPVGVAIGIVIDSTTQGSVADWTFAISMGLACGVFIYVSINHLLLKGYKSQKKVSIDTPHYKFLAVLFGVGVIAVVMIWDT